MGGSLLGKVLAPRNDVPVPLGGGGSSVRNLMSGFGGTGGGEDYLKAFGTVGTVWQIVHLLASSTAKPEWRLYRKTASDGRVRYATSDQGSDTRTEVVKHQALTVLGRPNPWYSRFALFEASQQYLDLAGECYWVIEYDPRASFPVGLWPVRPDRMDPVPDTRNYLKGWIYSAPDGREKISLDPREVLQVKYPNPLDPYHGLGPVQAILTDIDAARYSAEWNRNFFINSATPGGVIQVDHRLDDDEWENLTSQWRDSHRGVARAHRVAVLEAGATWVPNSMTVRDMDFATLRSASRDVIREAFGMHKVMLGVSDDVNRANAQTGEEVFSTWKIVPRLDRWKDALNQQFLPLFGAAGESVEFDYIYPRPTNREQDNAELTSKATAALTLVQAGYDPDDILEVVGLPAMGTVEVAPPPAAPAALPPGSDGESDAPATAADAELAAMLRDDRFRALAAWNHAGSRP